MYHILICDDEPDIVSALMLYLEADDYRLFTASNGAEAVRLADQETLHLILLDLMMPVMDGLTAMKRIREKHTMPIILLTAKGEDIDKIMGLNHGADDYVTKPFQPMELLARVNAQLRRYTRLGGSKLGPSQIQIGGIRLDDKAKAVTVEGEPVNLTPTEYDILHFLMCHPGQVFSPKTLYEQVWQQQSLGSVNTIAVHIRHLREKIEVNPAQPRYLKVVWGQGYQLAAVPEHS